MARLIATSGTKQGLKGIIRRYFYGLSSMKINLNTNGSVARLKNGKYVVYSGFKWELKRGRYRFLEK